jgi:periplasmic copper chaperone A
VFTRIHCAAFLLALALIGTAFASEPQTGSLTILQPWARATPPGATVGAAYLEILNSGASDTLLRIETPVARNVQMHNMSTENGVMRMRQMSSVNVPAHGRVLFDPEGLHVMLIDLVQPLREGQRFPMTLVFEHAGRVTVQTMVRGLGAMSPSAEGPAHP